VEKDNGIYIDGVRGDVFRIGVLGSDNVKMLRKIFESVNQQIKLHNISYRCTTSRQESPNELLIEVKDLKANQEIGVLNESPFSKLIGDSSGIYLEGGIIR
jgi:hypothetical protein